MVSTMKDKVKKSTHRLARWKHWLHWAAFVLVAFLAVAAYVIDTRGGWDALYRMGGVSLGAPYTDLLADAPTSVTVFDVGQGDAVLIGQDGAYCLIDTGPADAQAALVRDLQLAGITDLDYLVLTHPHVDHTGGAKEILRNFTVGQLLLPVWQPEDETTDWPRGLLQLAEEKGITVAEPADGTVYPLGSGTLTILQSGDSELYDSEEDSSSAINNISLCTLFAAGDFRYLSTGDAEAEAEQRLVDRYGKALHATLYKAGHHGSATSSSEVLLQAVRPQAAVISCGLNNSYGHPHLKTLQRLQNAGAEIYRTDTMGTLTFTWQDNALQVTAADALDNAA